jgi:hypothetical protein
MVLNSPSPRIATLSPFESFLFRNTTRRRERFRQTAGAIMSGTTQVPYRQRNVFGHAPLCFKIPNTVRLGQ